MKIWRYMVLGMIVVLSMRFLSENVVSEESFWFLIVLSWWLVGIILFFVGWTRLVKAVWQFTTKSIERN